MFLSDPGSRFFTHPGPRCNVVTKRYRTKSENRESSLQNTRATCKTCLMLCCPGPRSQVADWEETKYTGISRTISSAASRGSNARWQWQTKMKRFGAGSGSYFSISGNFWASQIKNYSTNTKWIWIIPFTSKTFWKKPWFLQFWKLLNNLLSLETDLNVPSVRENKNMGEKLTFSFWKLPKKKAQAGSESL
jgi:hypothetical protein